MKHCVMCVHVSVCMCVCVCILVCTHLHVHVHDGFDITGLKGTHVEHGLVVVLKKQCVCGLSGLHKLLTQHSLRFAHFYWRRGDMLAYCMDVYI